MTTNYEDAQAFNRKYTPDLVPEPYQPTLLSPELVKLTFKNLAEEVTEFHDACEAHDLVKAADALADIAYVAKRAADLMGLPWQAIWSAVHKANMTGKHRARYPEESKRHSILDVVKSPNFVAPDQEIAEILTRAAHAFEAEDDLGTGDHPPIVDELGQTGHGYQVQDEDDGGAS